MKTLGLSLLFFISGCYLLPRDHVGQIQNGLTILNNTNYRLIVFESNSSQSYNLLPGEHISVPIKIFFENRLIQINYVAKAYEDNEYIGVSINTLWIEHRYNRQGMDYSNNLPQTWIIECCSIRYNSD